MAGNHHERLDLQEVDTLRKTYTTAAHLRGHLRVDHIRSTALTTARSPQGSAQIEYTSGTNQDSINKAALDM